MPIDIPDGKDVYNKVQPKAEGVKAIVQMIIGIASIVALIVQFVIHFGEGMGDAADRALLVIGVALVFSAAIELAYTFFTDGPDEALDPLILGVSAFALILISQSRWTDNADPGNKSKNLANAPNLNDIAIPILLLALSILALFVARRFLLEVRKNGTSEKSETREKDQIPPDVYHG